MLCTDIEKSVKRLCDLTTGVTKNKISLAINGPTECSRILTNQPLLFLTHYVRGALMFRLTWEILLECQHTRHSRSSECPSQLPVKATLDRGHTMVSASQSIAPTVVHLVHSQDGTVCNVSQQASSICVSSSRSLGKSSRWPVNSIGQVLGVCLSPNCADAASALKVVALESVSCATGCFSSAPLAATSVPLELLVNVPRKIPPLP